MLLYTYVTEHVQAGQTPNDFQRFAPSVSFSLQPWEHEQFYVRLLYKSTFRMPTFNDLYYYQLGNRHLRPEKANEYNLGITWNRQMLACLDYLSLTLDAYFNDVTDKIVAFPTTYAWRMANFGTVHATGIDATLGTAVVLPHNMSLVLTGGYTWQRAIDLSDPEAKNYRDQLPYTPRHGGNASAILETPWLTLGYTLVGVSKRYCLSQNIPENEIAGYMEHTATLSRSFNLRRCSLTLKAELVNFTDEQYDVIKYYPMPGRSWRLTGSVSF